MILLKDYKIRELYFKNRLTARMSIELEQRQTFNVHYIQGRKECIGQCRIEIKSKRQDQPFMINIDVEGIFSYEDAADSDELHKEIYRELFPYVRVLINNLTIGAGIPPMLIRPIDMKDIKKNTAP